MRQLALYELKAKEAIKLEQYLRNIIKGTERISGINKELIKDCQPFEDKIEDVNIKALLEDCLAMFKDLLSLKGISVEKDLTSLDFPIRGNRFKNEQIFKNMALNAIDSMDDRPKKLLKITGTVDSDVFLMSIHIEDTGCGISKESIDKIFTPNFTTKENGNGIGLCIVQKLAKEMGCEILAESRVGTGSKFSVNFPMANV